MKSLPKANEIGSSFCQRLVCTHLVEAVIGDDHSAEQSLELHVVERRNRDASGVALAQWD